MKICEQIQFIKRPTVNTDLKLKEKSVIIMAKVRFDNDTSYSSSSIDS